MKLFLILFLLILPVSGLQWHQDTIVLNHEDLGSGVEAWTLNGSTNAREVAHFCHMHQPISQAELVYVLVGNRTIELSG